MSTVKAPCPDCHRDVTLGRAALRESPAGEWTLTFMCPLCGKGQTTPPLSGAALGLLRQVSVPEFPWRTPAEMGDRLRRVPGKYPYVDVLGDMAGIYAADGQLETWAQEQADEMKGDQGGTT